MRTSLLCTVTLACVIGAGPATAQSLRDIVKDGEGARTPAEAEWQNGAAGGNASTQTQTPNVVPAPAEPEPSPAPTRPTVTTLCLPPGMPALSELVSVGQQTLVAPVEGTDEIVSVYAVGFVRKDRLGRYRLGEAPVDFIAYFVRGHLAAVDDHPGDPSEPDIVDTGMVSPRGAALAQGTPMCQWTRLARPPQGGGRAAAPGDRI